MNRNRSKIMMKAYNPLTRRYEEVFPEDEVKIEQMIPLFKGGDNTYYTVPGVSAADVYDEWLAQVG